MNFSRYRIKKLFAILISRAVVFFLLMSLLTLFLYAAGTVQGFIDSTLLSLLRLYVFFGFFLAVTSFFSIVLNVKRFLKVKRGRYLLRAGGYALLTIFGLVTILAAMFILTVAEGNMSLFQN